jgi:type IV pilus assembly protein PilB
MIEEARFSRLLPMVITDDVIKKIVTESRALTDAELQASIAYAQSTGILLSEALIQKNIITDGNLGKLIASSLSVPFVSLADVSVTEAVYRLVPDKFARIHKIVPFARDADGLKVAMADPTDKQVIASLQKKTQQKIIVHYATARDIHNALQLHKRDVQTLFDDLMKRYKREDEAPISAIVDLLLHSAVDETTSDIHIEPAETDSLVRFRIDGILHDVLHFSRTIHSQVVSRIKVLANLRTDEHLAPQDGKIRIKYDDQSVDIRISIIPMVEGEKVVMRLLVSHFKMFSFEDLGMEEKEIAKINAALHHSYGMILSTGPTGSGKTTSIYAMLKTLNVREKNITTIEDPVEYRIKGVNQIQVNAKTNLTFANGLRSILRQDPNIIFVGEIRDSETAGIAINAALTGHLVVSTLHTNDAATSLPRLSDMHVEPFLVASSVSLIIAQRLVRRICEYCRVSTTIAEAELQKSLPAEIISKHYITSGANKEIRVYKGQGCKNCHFTGYAGRVGIFEVLEVSKEIRRLITERKDSDVIAQQAVKEGMLTMLDDGLQKVSKGITTIEEILRVTKVESL